MFKRISTVILFFIILLSFLSLGYVYSAECDDKTGSEKINCLEQKLQQLKQQKNTLSSQIQYMDTQVYLTILQINETEQKITNTEKEINLLGSRIEGLDQSLDYLSKQLIKRIVVGYKKKPFSILSLLFDYKNADDFLNQVKYLKTAQDNNQKLLYRVQETKTNAEEQKKSREEKKVELGRLTEKLNLQKLSLNNQKSQKQKLLSDTQSDETTYQKLLAQAQAQLSGFRSFVSNAGAGIIGANQFGTGSDGSYFSQRDARWANQTIGYSNENILNVGCLLTSVSMMLKKHGADVNPSTIASTPDYFWASTAYMNYRWNISLPNGLHGYSLSVSEIDSELNSGNYVIVGVGYNGCHNGGDHYVVLTKKDGDDYKMHDPIYGPDISFNSHYSLKCSAETIR